MNKQPVEKNKEYIVDIIDNGFEGEGIAKIDNFTIFINGAIKGEKVKILIVKVLSLKMKQNAVQSLVNKTLKNKIDVKETLRNGKSISLQKQSTISIRTK